MSQDPRTVRGEFTVEHLRPIAEKLPEFMPLWDARLAISDEVTRIEDGLSTMVIPLVHEKTPTGSRFLAPVRAFKAWLDSLQESNAVLESSDEYLAAISRLRELQAQDAKLVDRMRPLQYVVGEPEVFSNLVTNVGKNDILDKYLKGSAYTQTFRMGLKGAGAAAAGDTQASHATWTERGLANAPAYTGNRKDVVMGAAASQVSTSPTQAFAITSSGTVDGCFTNNGGSATKDDTTGILFSAGDFSAAKTVANLDTLNVVYTLTAT